MYAASCTPKVLAYVMVLFFNFKSLKLYSVLECWYILTLYTGKLFTVSFPNNLSCFFFFPFFPPSEHQLNICAEQSTMTTRLLTE